MKLDCVVSSCTIEPLYYDFIPLFIKSWKTLYPDVDIKIILINDVIPDDIKQFNNQIILFKPIENISNAFVSQIIRLFYPCILNHYENGILITDIDMIPMNNYYYTEPIKDIPNNKFICYRDCLLNEKQLPICYNIATYQIWSNIFNINCLDDIITNIIKYNNDYKSNWFTDQLVLYKTIMDFKNKTNNFIILNDNITKFNRLNRCSVPNTNVLLKTIKSKKYSDYHMERPYNKHKNNNDLIINTLIETYSV